MARATTNTQSLGRILEKRTGDCREFGSGEGVMREKSGLGQEAC